MSTLEIEVGDLCARSVEFSGNELVVTLKDGRRIATPLDWYPRLVKASPKQRARYEIMPMGIHWPDVDEDLSIAGMLKGSRARADVVRDLLIRAKTMPVTHELYERQRRSFVYGNAALDNNNITREIIDREADKLSKETHG
jgi:Protein of unknown function (DUF2442)